MAGMLEMGWAAGQIVDNICLLSLDVAGVVVVRHLDIAAAGNSAGRACDRERALGLVLMVIHHMFYKWYIFLWYCIVVDASCVLFYLLKSINFSVYKAYLVVHLEMLYVYGVGIVINGRVSW